MHGVSLFTEQGRPDGAGGARSGGGTDRKPAAGASEDSPPGAPDGSLSVDTGHGATACRTTIFRRREQNNRTLNPVRNWPYYYCCCCRCCACIWSSIMLRGRTQNATWGLLSRVINRDGVVEFVRPRDEERIIMIRAERRGMCHGR